MRKSFVRAWARQFTILLTFAGLIAACFLLLRLATLWLPDPWEFIAQVVLFTAALSAFATILDRRIERGRAREQVRRGTNGHG